MSEKEDNEEFEDDDDAATESDDVDIDNLFRDLDKRKKAAVKAGDPAWRRLEKYREQQHTAELVSDFDDYNIDDAESLSPSRKHVG
jgi:hypothetical protein